MRLGTLLLLCLLLLGCGKDNDLSQTNPWRLSDQAIKDRICSKANSPVTWVRSSTTGLDEMVFSRDQVSASYKINRPTGVQEYSGLTFDIYRDKDEKKVHIRFFRKGLEWHDEPMTRLSADTWQSDADSTVYVRK
jgi:hypothetical protein